MFLKLCRILELGDEDISRVMDLSKQIQNQNGPSLVSSWIDFLETASQGESSKSTQQQQQQQQQGNELK